MSDNNGSVNRGKSFAKKLTLRKETVRELRDADLRKIAGGVPPSGPTCNSSCTVNHNEKIVTVEQKKDFRKKLFLSKETIRELRDSDLRAVVGGLADRKQGGSRSCPTNEC